MKFLLKKIIVWILTIEAKIILKKYKPKIVAVTGSVGKTSSKDAIYAALSSSFFVRKSEKSFNSEIGIPLTILGVPNAWSNIGAWAKNIFEGFILILLRSHYPKWLILEVGADRPADIRKLAKWLSPDIVVVTRLPDVPVHVEFFESPEEVIEEKAQLVKALKADGFLILNGDDKSVMSLRASTSAAVRIYGISEKANIRAANDAVIYDNGKPAGISFRVEYNGNSIPMTLRGALGMQSAYAVLSALAVGVSQNLNIVSMGRDLSEYMPPPGRMRVLEGLNNSTIIDDSYNSSPVALDEALSVLEKVTAAGKKIAVLGDMMELGSYSVEAHKKAGERAADIADKLFTVGVRARYFAEGARKGGMAKSDIEQFNDSRTAGRELAEKLADGDIALVKGSQSARMERVVEKIMAEPEKKKVLLVRQEKEWKNR